MEESTDAHIERQVWSKCFLCEKDYSKDIRINTECLHSYCFDCIQQRATFSNICPICNVPLPFPISSLPKNFSLQYWSTISPPLNDNINFQQIKNVIPNEINCSGCEERVNEVFCNECNQYYCLECSKVIHSLKTKQSHYITSTLNKFSLSNEEQTKYYICKQHINVEVKLYCVNCNEFLCLQCLFNSAHSLHQTITVNKYVELVKETWKQFSNNSLKEGGFLFQLFGELGKKEISLKDQIDDFDLKINRLQLKINDLNAKKKSLVDQVDLIYQSKYNLDLTNRFLSSFVDSLHSLPLSTFYSQSSPILIDIFPTLANLNTTNGYEEKSNRRIRNFFEKENLMRLYGTFIDEFMPTNIPNTPSFNSNQIDLQNQLILSSRLIPNENLILSFGSKGGNQNQFVNPYFLAINSKLDLIAISDYSNHRVQFYNTNGSFNCSLKIQNPLGISILSEYNLIAVSSMQSNKIQLYSVNNNQITDLKATIGQGKGSDSGQLNGPRGLVYNSSLNILAVCDWGNQRVQFFQLIGKIRKGKDLLNFGPWEVQVGKDMGEVMGNLVLKFNPWAIDISSSGEYLVISEYINKHRIHIFKLVDKKTMSWKEIKVIGTDLPGSNDSQFENPYGVSINEQANYFIVCDFSNSRLQFFSLSSGEFICSFKPLKEDEKSFFPSPYGVSIDVDENIIAVSDSATSKITLINSPFF